MSMINCIWVKIRNTLFRANYKKVHITIVMKNQRKWKMLLTINEKYITKIIFDSR